MKWTASAIPSQAGRLAIVTGANSGIGWHTALELARAGGEVMLAARSESKGIEAVERIKQQLPRANVRYAQLDLASLASIKRFAGRAIPNGVLDLLVNNAGVMSVPTRQTTADGFELQFGTNFLGPVALTAMLMPALLRSASPRVTTVSSGAANMGMKRINFDDLQGETSYHPWKAYCQSKLADLILMLELGRRCKAAGIPIISNAAHPGWARTNLQTSGPGRPQNVIEKFAGVLLSQDASRGALPTLRAATSIDTVSGDYFAPAGLFQLTGNPVRISLPKPAQDHTAADRLWNMAKELIGTRWPIDPSSTKPQDIFKDMFVAAN